MKNKILILKNDRVGDLFTSIKLISSLCLKNHDIKLYLSHLNMNFSIISNLRTNLVKNIPEIDRIYVNNRFYILYKI